MTNEYTTDAGLPQPPGDGEPAVPPTGDGTATGEEAQDAGLTTTPMDNPPGDPRERGRDKVIAKLRETVPLLAEAIQKRVTACPTRMKTRTALIEPVIQDVLAFDLRNPFEVDPDPQEIVGWLAAAHPDVDWTAYALMQAAKPMMHIVALPSTDELPDPAVITTRIPCIPTRTPIAWTNGMQWAFVVRTTDDDDADAVVAHDFDFSNHTLVDIDELATFTRESLSDDQASDRIYSVYAERRAAEWLARELQEPSTAFVELAVGACHQGRKTQAVVAAYADAVPKAIETVLRNLRAGTETDIARRARPPEPDTSRRERLVGRVQGRIQKTGRGVNVARWLMEKAAEDDGGRSALWAAAGAPEHSCLAQSLEEMTDSRRDRATKIAGTEIWFAAGASIRAMKTMLDDLMNRLPTTHRLLLEGYSVDMEKTAAPARTANESRETSVEEETPGNPDAADGTETPAGNAEPEGETPATPENAPSGDERATSDGADSPDDGALSHDAPAAEENRAQATASADRGPVAPENPDRSEPAERAEDEHRTDPGGNDEDADSWDPTNPAMPLMPVRRPPHRDTE